ncbi:hypothetical protein J421_6155 (plasmid) [Gemmatirosa kalamazoonensis]|uniref:Uncharacterized protein n=1 Tax=Gemmatirosa kalamazoonensis TaxID=861299 RepID=W0RTT0_9BACT|nr:hypothetical protein [Gemmatirosa kalamazoonensis]AHG93690.1 hypothetical protein J421_6155 [Gemmatirosa kalamazoonensis]
MRANVDVRQALELLAKLEPELVAHASTFAADTPWRDDGEALDRALLSGLTRLRVEVGRATFVYLRWHAERVHASTVTARAAGGTPEMGRVVSDADGRRWTVWEVAPNDLFGGASPRWLVFHSSVERRQTTDYPPDWRVRSEQALCELLMRADAARDRRSEAPRGR